MIPKHLFTENYFKPGKSPQNRIDIYKNDKKNLNKAEFKLKKWTTTDKGVG